MLACISLQQQLVHKRCQVNQVEVGEFTHGQSQALAFQGSTGS